MTLGLNLESMQSDPRTVRRTDALYRRQRRAVMVRTDRMFGVLMLLQWVAGVLIAMTLSPRAWAGTSSSIHPHVFAAIFLGGAITSFPALLAWRQPGLARTRYVIAVGQMLWSGLLIHLAGGRIEAHFHVFGSLAFLAIYRDWRVLIPATIVVALDHLLRGMFWPESIYGVTVAPIWRTLEHAGWVIFEDVFLVISCVQQARDMRTSALRQAEVEASKRLLQSAATELRQTHAELEQRVVDRTTELRDRNEELVRVTAVAESANLAKSAFLANMSHEIRTPMTAILGFSEVLLEAGQTMSERHDSLHVIRRNARHLLDLINDVLDISKIEAGKMTIESVSMDLMTEIGDVVSIMRPRALEKGLQFRCEFDGPIPRKIRTDPLRVKQILMNLLGNAMKFTERGQLCVRVRCEAKESDSRIYFEISDTGIGMTSQQIDRIFQPFTQADESTTRRFGGSGLGLTISQRLARLLGGELLVKSQPGKGSTFTAVVAGGSLQGVEMIHDARESMLVPTIEPTTKKITLTGRILLVEDGLDNQQLISMHLRKAGATVEIADNGRIAVDKAAVQQFDLILMDMQMPEMDGYTAAGILRERGMTLPIIALTAHAMSEDRAKCLAAGCSDYLSKPVPKDLLLRTIANTLNKATPEDAVAVVAQSTPEVSGKIRSSYAGDPDMQELIQTFASRLSHRVELMTDLVRQNELEKLRQVVHQLKGAGGGYGFAEITHRAADVERAIKSGAAMEAVAGEITSLVGLLQRVEGYAPHSPSEIDATMSI